MMNMSSPFMSGRILCVLQDFVGQVAGRRIQYHQSYHELSRRECLTKVILPEFDHFFIHEICRIDTRYGFYVNMFVLCTLMNLVKS